MKDIELDKKVVIKGKPIKGFENYLITEDGKIYSCFSRRYLKLILNNLYYCVTLYDFKGNRVQKNVHRLVAETFIPNPNNYPVVNHKDENKLNNNVNNLEWCTHEYNLKYGTASTRAKEHQDYLSPGRINYYKKRAKELAIPVLQFTKDGTFIKKYDSIMDAQKETGIPNSNISRCCQRKPFRNVAGGYVWRYESEIKNNFKGGSTNDQKTV